MVLLVAASCRFSQRPNPNVLTRYVAVADEPQAAEIGREILAERGSAVDAAVIMALTMAVTLPSRVGLGGGGVCLIHDPRQGEVRAIDFLPRGTGAGGAAEPNFLRGLAALHAEYGTRRWEQVVTRAEALARFGAPASRALVRDVAAAAGRPVPAAFLGLGEGAPVIQPDLANALGQIRTGGIGAFYTGPLGRAYAEAATAAGPGLSTEQIRAAQTRWLEPLAVEAGDDTLFFAPLPETHGPILAEAATRLIGSGDFAALDPAARAARLGQMLAGGAGGQFGATLATMSQDEMAVVCGFTLNGLWGSGRTAGGTGIIVAPGPPPAAPALGGLALLTNVPRKVFILAAASADRPAALAVPLAEILLAGRPADQAMAAPRTAGDLAAPGSAEAAGRGAVIFCDWDRAAGKRCTGAADPRGFGLALDFER